ncbi:hypothetical protein RND81_10G202400 [Saponaria officinalis]|uniref:NAC domain-containing protein n=1 Tax=Saponaria officinalis TaxID=3572 RepID=A0AAW1I518_SAPOF
MERPNYVGNNLTILPPGLRFHPTDEEILFEYLRCKVFSLPLPASVIPEVDFLKFDPWDLPGNVEEIRYYFYKKKTKNRKQKRVTRCGYWKSSGSTKQISPPTTYNLGMFTQGFKKSFVFCHGKPTNGRRTHWFMHEYSLHFHNCENFNEEEWVICKVFMKQRTEEVYDSSLLEEQCSDNNYTYSMNNVGPSTYNNCPSPTSSSNSIYI